MTYAVETFGLSYAFTAGDPVLKDIQLQVPKGAIYGFLGKNGAGKTTTLRLLLGLLKNQTGDIRFCGKPFAANRIEILQKVGSMIESPSLYGHLTAMENLAIWQKIYQCPKSRMQEVLELVSLADTKAKKARQFSLGMKQRLSIAIAMLNNPEVLVLDEPTNGLDPNGIQEMRELLRKLAREFGTTLIVSSHLLSEVEKLVSHVGIIHDGSLIFQGTLKELIDQQHQPSQVSILTNDGLRAKAVLDMAQISATLDGGALLLPFVSNAEIARINLALVQNDIEVYQLMTLKNDLESVYMNLIKN